MKMYIGLFFIFYIFFQINNLSYSQDDRWVYIVENNASIYYIDKETVKCDKNGNIEAWTKEYCLSDCIEKTFREEDIGKTIDYMITKIKYYPSERKYETLYFTFYYTDNSHYGIENPYGKVSVLIPDSVGEIVYKYIIENYTCK